MSNVLFLALYVTFFIHFLVCACASNIPGTAEWIFTKFIVGTCLVPRLDEFEGQGHQGQKKRFSTPVIPAATEWSHLLHAAVTLTFDLDIQGHCVRLMFGKTSLALV